MTEPLTARVIAGVSGNDSGGSAAAPFFQFQVQHSVRSAVMLVGADAYRSTLLRMHLCVWHAALLRAILWLTITGSYLVLRFAFCKASAGLLL